MASESSELRPYGGTGSHDMGLQWDESHIVANLILFTGLGVPAARENSTRRFLV